MRPERSLPDACSLRPKIAIACQGGGSHTAFTAGVLKEVFADAEHEIVGFSGASGGAICALLAWYGLLSGGPGRASELLESFWRENSANDYWDMVVNDLFVEGSRFQGLVAVPEISPYFYPSIARNRLKDLLESHVEFDELEGLIRPGGPDLLVSAVEVLSGEFKIFRESEVTAETILASAAVPNLFRAVRIGAGVYWDGLFSRNPPVREFLSGRSASEKPDEIWVIQINPQRRPSEPTTTLDILDRRNELAGNLSLNQEVEAIQTINDLLPHLPPEKYKEVTLRRIGLKKNLDAASKLDRSPSFIRELISHGEEQARAFLAFPERHVW